MSRRSGDQRPTGARSRRTLERRKSCVPRGGTTRGDRLSAFGFRISRHNQESDTHMDFTKLNGLIPAVVQVTDSGEVLMVGFMNAEALQLTLATGFATFYSRSRQALWLKGETSGNRLAVRQVLTDCDDDSVVVKVQRLGDGNVCHTGTRTCFTTALDLGSAANAGGAALHSSSASPKGLCRTPRCSCLPVRDSAST